MWKTIRREQYPAYVETRDDFIIDEVLPLCDKPIYYCYSNFCFRDIISTNEKLKDELVYTVIPEWLDYSFATKSFYYIQCAMHYKKMTDIDEIMKYCIERFFEWVMRNRRGKSYNRLEGRIRKWMRRRRGGKTPKMDVPKGGYGAYPLDWEKLPEYTKAYDKL